MAEQLRQMEKLGGMGSIMGMLPGMGKIKGQIDEAKATKNFKQMGAIISSMTPKERRLPKILDGRRKRRIAAGSGTTPADINKLLKMHMQMADVMKMMGRNKGMMGKMASMMGLPAGGMGSQPSADELAAMQAELSKLDPKALEQLPAEVKEELARLQGGGSAQSKQPMLPGGFSGLPKGLPGLGSGLPGLGGGFPKFPGLPGKKK
jgi:signal recognition particle subunit SRP54